LSDQLSTLTSFPALVRTERGRGEEKGFSREIKGGAVKDKRCGILWHASSQTEPFYHLLRIKLGQKKGWGGQ